MRLIVQFFRFIIAFCLLVVGACKSQKTANVATPLPSFRFEAAQDSNALLWQITGKGLKKASFLYGTIHMIPKVDFFMTDATKAAVAATQKVTFEINMREMKNPLKLLGIMSKANMKNGKKLSDLISAEDYALVQARFDSLGMPLKMFERMKPMFLSSMLEGDGAKADAQSSTSYEMEIMKMAEKDKKETDGLETIDFQLSMFDSIPYTDQAKMLVDAIKEQKDSNDDFRKLIDLYKSQNVYALEAMMQTEDGGIGNYQDLLLTRRNRNWIPKMEAMMLLKPTFFAVGAGHLGGKEGVISLLKQQGYTLTPMK